MAAAGVTDGAVLSFGRVSSFGRVRWMIYGIVRNWFALVRSREWRKVYRR